MNKITQLLNDPTLVNKTVLVKTPSNPEVLVYLLGTALLKLIGYHGSKDRPTVVVKGPEGYRDDMGIDEAVERAGYSIERVSYGGVAADKFLPPDTKVSKRPEVLVYITDKEDQISLLDFNKVSIPMMELGDRWVLVLPSVAHSEVYTQIEEQSSTVVYEFEYE